MSFLTTFFPHRIGKRVGDYCFSLGDDGLGGAGATFLGWSPMAIVDVKGRTLFASSLVRCWGNELVCGPTLPIGFIETFETMSLVSIVKESCDTISGSSGLDLSDPPQAGPGFIGNINSAWLGLPAGFDTFETITEDTYTDPFAGEQNKFDPQDWETNPFDTNFALGAIP